MARPNDRLGAIMDERLNRGERPERQRRPRGHRGRQPAGSADARDRDRRMSRESHERPGPDDVARLAAGQGPSGRHDSRRSGPANPARDEERTGSSEHGRDAREQAAGPQSPLELALAGHQAAPGLDDEAALEVLRDGRLDILGRLVDASNVTLYGTVTRECPDPALNVVATCVYKPIRGERPLADFPDGTLAFREVAAYAVSARSGWRVVPPTVLRDGPYGTGMVQYWIDVDPEIDVGGLIRVDDPRLRRIAVLDAVLNNADRKGGHLLPVRGGHIHAVDHGVCFATTPKLRTILWAWRGTAFDPSELATLEELRTAMDGSLGQELRRLLTSGEVAATRRRVDRLLSTRRFPHPDPNWPAVPWPPF